MIARYCSQIQHTRAACLAPDSPASESLTNWFTRNVLIGLFKQVFVVLLLSSATGFGNAYAFENCVFQPSSYAAEVEISAEDRAFLGTIESIILEHYPEYRLNFIESRLKRLQYADSLVSDLIYTLRFMEDRVDFNDHVQILASVVFNFLGRDFGISYDRFERFSIFDKNYEVILSEPEFYFPLIEYHVRGYNFLRWFGLCANQSPYNLYYTAARTLSRSSSSIEKPSRTKIRLLRGSTPIIKRFYRSSTRSPSIRFVLPPCDQETTEIQIVDLRFDPKRRAWEKYSPAPAPGAWYLGGFGDMVLPGHQTELMTAKIFEGLSELNEAKFLDRQTAFGLPVKMPETNFLNCRE